MENNIKKDICTCMYIKVATQQKLTQFLKSTIPQ